jgi:putative hydrolase of the HAD superfamily
MENHTNTVKAVVFDLGKVLVDFDYSIALRAIAARARISAEDLEQFVTRAPLLLKYESGLLTSQQFYDEICAASGFRGSIDEFATLFGDIFTPIEPMIQLQQQLRGAGVPTFVFSNTNDLAIRHIRRTFPFFSGFDGYALSYEHGVMKPDPRFYEVLERQAARTGAEILYFDDRPENVAAGAARGWAAVLHESPAKSGAFAQNLGLLNDSV